MTLQRTSSNPDISAQRRFTTNDDDSTPSATQVLL